MENKENRFDVLFWGDWALFSNPLTMLSGSKYSYSVPPLSALKGMMKAIYWKPSIEWEIESVEILNPIQRETKNVLLQADKYQSSQRGTNNYLKDVTYRVKGHLVASKYKKQFAQDQQHNLQKHVKIAHTRFARGNGYTTPVLGVSECRAFACETQQRPDLVERSYYVDKELHLDMMLLDIIYPLEPEDDMYRIFWTPVVQDGVISFPSIRELDEIIMKWKNKQNVDGYVVEAIPPGSYNISRPWWIDSEDPVINDVQ